MTGSIENTSSDSSRKLVASFIAGGVQEVVASTVLSVVVSISWVAFLPIKAKLIQRIYKAYHLSDPLVALVDLDELLLTSPDLALSFPSVEAFILLPPRLGWDGV